MQDGTAIGQPTQSRAGQQLAEVDARQQQVGAAPVAVASTEQRILQHAQQRGCTRLCQRGVERRQAKRLDQFVDHARWQPGAESGHAQV